MLVEYDANWVPIRWYVNGTGVDNQITINTATNTYYYHKDGLGSVTHISDGNGDVVEKYEYSPFGKVTIKDSSNNVIPETTIGNHFLFTGRTLDKETGLYNYRARYYDAEIGRFLSNDPLGYYDSMNLYGYCFNSPNNWVDPLGLRLAVVSISPGIGISAAGHTAIISGNKAYSTFLGEEGNKGIAVYDAEEFIQAYRDSGRDVTIFELEDKSKDRLENGFNAWVKDAEEGFYFVIGNNCADFVVRALNEIGVVDGNFSYLGAILPAGYGNSPMAVSGYLRADYKEMAGQGVVREIKKIGIK